MNKQPHCCTCIYFYRDNSLAMAYCHKGKIVLGGDIACKQYKNKQNEKGT